MNRLISDLLLYCNITFEVKDDGYEFNIHQGPRIKVINPGECIEEIQVDGKMVEFPKLAGFILGLRFPSGSNPDNYKEMFK